MENNRQIGIYLHIPFCIKKCNYCAFLSSPQDESTREKYVQALIREIELCKGNFTSEISTIYIGGGTPSVLSTDQIERIILAVRDNFDIADNAEITLEANPGTLGDSEDDVKNTLHKYREIGINRLSMGVQSMDNEVLKFVGRIHTAEDVDRDYRIAREAGFDNINLDLMFSLPIEHSHDLAMKSLAQIIDMKPEHISCYSLQIEEGTPFGKLYDEGKLHEIPDDEDRDTYHEICDILASAGYDHYEISNWSLPGRYSRHNSSYWNMSEYIGLGLGASGYENGVRYRNVSNLNDYIKMLADDDAERSDLREEQHINTEHDNISEAVFTGLRRMEGIRFGDLPETVDSSDKFWRYYNDEKQDALSFVGSGHLVIDNDGMHLTEAGIDISNTIMSLFV